jgi:hypothetical protein
VFVCVCVGEQWKGSRAIPKSHLCDTAVTRGWVLCSPRLHAPSPIADRHSCRTSGAVQTAWQLTHCTAEKTEAHFVLDLLRQHCLTPSRPHRPCSLTGLGNDCIQVWGYGGVHREGGLREPRRCLQPAQQGALWKLVIVISKPAARWVKDGGRESGLHLLWFYFWKLLLPTWTPYPCCRWL